MYVYIVRMYERTNMVSEYTDGWMDGLVWLGTVLTHKEIRGLKVQNEWTKKQM